MDIATYRQAIHAIHYPAGTLEVLLRAIKVAEEMDHDFVEPAHILLALHRRGYTSNLESRMNACGLTEENLEQCVRACGMGLQTYRARMAVETMFREAMSLAECRSGDTGNRNVLVTLGDVMYACVISGSRVIDTIIRDGLQTTIFDILVELNASDDLVLRYFPTCDYVENITSAKMSAAAAVIYG